jgi:hypothetical protein
MEPVNTEPVASHDDAPQTLEAELKVDLHVDLAETRERLGIPDPDAPDAEKETAAGIAEVEYLRHAVREQAQGRLDALHAAEELQAQLAAAQAESTKPKTQYYGVPKSRGALTRAESELAETITKLHAAKKELDWEQRARRADGIQATTTIRRLEKELAEAKAVFTESGSKIRPVYLRIAAGAAAAIVLTAGIAMVARHFQNPVSASASVTESASATAEPASGDQTAQLAAWQSKSSVLRHPAPAAHADFTQSVSRLGDALAALPGRDPEEVLRQVQQAGKGCELRWNGGEPSLLFGDRGKDSPSFGDAMALCAESNCLVGGICG